MGDEEDFTLVTEEKERPEAGHAEAEHPALRRARVAARVAEENRGRDIVILDMRSETAMFDYFVVASGVSRRQLHAMSEEIDRVFQQELGDRRIGLEGYQASNWILMDYGDVVVHLFEPETRAYYAIEDLWAGAQRVPLGNALSPSPHD